MKKKPVVLFVDDETSVLHAMRRVFHQERFRAVTVSSAEEAAMTLVTLPVRVIVCDYHMRGMNGVDFLANTKQRFPQIARILLTGDISQKVETLADGRCDLHQLFHKPVDPDELLNSIYEAVN